MSDSAQSTALQELEHLLPHIRRLEVENKATEDEKAATTEATIGEHLAKVLARDATLQHENMEQRAVRKWVSAAEAAPIIEAIRAAPQAVESSAASIMDRLGALPNLHKATLLATGFPDPDGAPVSEAQSLDLKTKDPKYARDFVLKRLKKHCDESLAAADLTVSLAEPDVGEPGPAGEEFKTPTAQHQRAEGLGVKQRRSRAKSPLDLLERIHGEILAGNWLIAAETLRLGTNAIRTLVQRKELTVDEGQVIIAELRAAAISSGPAPPSQHDHRNDTIVVELSRVRGACE